MISLKSKHLAVIVPVVFAAGIGLTMAFNLWKTESTKVPAAYTSGEFAGTANPADIRGSYTFAEIAAAFPVPVEALARAFGVVENAAAFQVKSLEGASQGLPEGVEIGTDSVRLFVARYAGLPFEPKASTALPAEAVGILVARPGLGAELVTDLQARAVDGEPTVMDAVAATEDHPAATEARAIKGRTTFKELLDWGVSEADVRSVFDGEMGATGVAVRDYCTQQGIEFSTVKTTLQALVDAAAP